MLGHGMEVLNRLANAIGEAREDDFIMIMFDRTKKDGVIIELHPKGEGFRDDQIIDY